MIQEHRILSTLDAIDTFDCDMGQIRTEFEVLKLEIKKELDKNQRMNET